MGDDEVFQSAAMNPAVALLDAIMHGDLISALDMVAPQRRDVPTIMNATTMLLYATLMRRAGLPAYATTEYEAFHRTHPDVADRLLRQPMSRLMTWWHLFTELPLVHVTYRARVNVAMIDAVMTPREPLPAPAPSGVPVRPVPRRSTPTTGPRDVTGDGGAQ